MKSLQQLGAVIVALVGLTGPPVGVYVSLATQLTELRTIVDQREVQMGEHPELRNRISVLNAEIEVMKVKIQTLEAEEDISSKTIGELRTAVAQLEVIVRMLGSVE